MMTNEFLDAVMQGGDMCYQIALILKRFFTMLAIKNLGTIMHYGDCSLNLFLRPMRLSQDGKRII